MSSRASARDLSAGYVRINESDLRKTGLRGRKLVIVVVCLVALWILALATLICNILLMVVLRMNHRGMESLQFMRVSGEGDGDDHLVQFTGEHMDLGTIVINSGVLAGFKNQDFKLIAAQVILESKDTSPPARMTIEGERIRLENVKNFLVTSKRSEGPLNEKSASPSQVLFQATKPTFRLKKSIMRLASAKIVTNKIRSPTSSNLSIWSSQTLKFHGSDGCSFEAKAVRLTANQSIIFRVEDQGTIKFTGQRGITLSRAPSMPISESPAFKADRLGLRLCVCKKTGRLFGVYGNERCRIREAYCH